MAAALTDAKRLPQDVAYRTGYLSLHNIPTEARADAVKVLTLQANSISRNGERVRPRSIAGGLLLAVVLDDYGWKRKTWDKMAEHDPYFQVQVYYPAGTYSGAYFAAGYYPEPAPWTNEAAHRELMKVTYNFAPVVRADWWFVQTCRQLSLNDEQNGIGYYDWLGIRQRADFEKLVKFSEKDSLEFGFDKQAALERSGVSQHNRKIDFLRALGGGYYRTLDTKSNIGNENAIQNLKRKDYRHAAEEHVAFLGNGLIAWLLCDAAGALQASAPDFIGPDRSPLNDTDDGRIHVGISCIRCHVEGGLRPVNDWVRRTVQLPLGLAAKDYKDLLDLRRQYSGNLETLMDKDRAIYTDAVKDLTGWTVPENAKQYAAFYSRYAAKMRGPAEIGLELGVPAVRVMDALKAYAGNPKNTPLPIPVAGLLQTPPVPLRVEHLEENFAVIAGAVMAYQPVEQGK